MLEVACLRAGIATGRSVFCGERGSGRRLMREDEVIVAQ
jgi:hypothetical protein